LSTADALEFQEAQQNIPLYRQGDLRIVLHDSDGNPLSGYIVNYQQITHDFMFGGNTDPWNIETLQQAGINTVTPYLEWDWEERASRDIELDFLDYWMGVDELSSGGIHVKASDGNFGLGEGIPIEFMSLPFEDFLSQVHDYSFYQVSKFADSVDVWYTIGEPNFGNHNILNLSRDQYFEVIAADIRAIREADPTALVSISLSFPCGGLEWLDNSEIVQEMLDWGLDFDLLGLQLYYNAAIYYYSPETFDPETPIQFTKMSLAEISACVDRYEAMLAPYGKRIDIGEMSVSSYAPAGYYGYWDVPWSEDTQAQYLTTAYTILFSKPSTMSLVWWDSADPGAFVLYGGLLDESGKPKRSFYALQQLVASWTTSGQDVTGSDGSLVIRGFGGDYNIEIIDPQSGAYMESQVHIYEQQNNTVDLTFTPDNGLLERRDQLEELVAYWEFEDDATRVQKGRDYLALADYHLQRGERDLTEQSLSAGLAALVIQIEKNIPIFDMTPTGFLRAGFRREYGSWLLWASTTLHYGYHFPPGQAIVTVTAHANSVAEEWPIMVIGVGAHYSEPLVVNDLDKIVFTFTTDTTGDEQEITIRFPYYGDIYQRIEQAGEEVGELKLYIDSVHITKITSGSPLP
jgi:hypothetical protein